MKYNPIDKCVGDYFKRHRLSMRYSMQAVADKLGTQKSSYYYYEIGKVSMPFEYVKILLDFYQDDGNQLMSEMQKAFQNYLVQLYATIHGYNVTSSEDYEKEKVG